MSDIAAPRTEAAPLTGTGGPRDRKQVLEHVLGWTLTVLVAMLVVQLHLM